jgi:hypothetical protein
VLPHRPCPRADYRLRARFIYIGELDALGVDDGPIVVNDVEKVAGHFWTTTRLVSTLHDPSQG